ncbi:MAG: hypothetical protein HQK84_12495 [Nitrospinae bacterium]|nr:hypothetical protein [Nitrospinota bacterium]
MKGYIILALLMFFIASCGVKTNPVPPNSSKVLKNVGEIGLLTDNKVSQKVLL